MKLVINGQSVDVEADPETPLLWVLRDILGLTGTKYGCGIAMCGACTVHIDGEPQRSCQTTLGAIDGDITTIETESPDEILATVQEAWIEGQVAQCGYCQSGQIMQAAALLRETPSPDDDQINDAMSGNLCRCGTYPRISAAIKAAAAKLQGA